MMKNHIFIIGLAVSLAALTSCGGNKEKSNDSDEQPVAVNSDGEVVNPDSVKDAVEGLPFSPSSVREHVFLDYDKRVVRADPDETIHPAKVKDKHNCFIVMSKKDYYLYVYERQGNDTVMVARYDCCFAVHPGNKAEDGDGKTPSCDMAHPFHIQQIVSAHDWHHDFGDGRGSIRSYGDYFMRLKLDGHKLSNNRSIGIHGSTNNRESVPGRASEGCIRLKDEDIVDLAENYAYTGMPVIIKDEKVDDLPFEIKAMKRQNIKRLRHFAHSMTIAEIDKATPEQGRRHGEPSRYADEPQKSASKSEGKSIVVDNDSKDAKQEKKEEVKEETKSSADGEGHGFVVDNKGKRVK